MLTLMHNVYLICMPILLQVEMCSPKGIMVNFQLDTRWFSSSCALEVLCSVQQRRNMDTGSCQLIANAIDTNQDAKWFP